MLYVYMRLLLVVNLLLLFVTNSQATPNQRCENLVQEVRMQHAAIFGLDFPYHYAVGQLQQESNCRNIISNDGVGSQGVSQVTWSMWGNYLQKKGIDDLSSTENQIKSQAYINYDAWIQAKPKKLWVGYQIYNGGRLVLKEISASGKEDWKSAKEQCHRKVITFKSGQKIDACEINYDYSQKLYKYGKLYQIFDDSKHYTYW